MFVILLTVVQPIAIQLGVISLNVGLLIVI
jgi:hypothetical protein